MGGLTRASIVVTAVTALVACKRGVPAPDPMGPVSVDEATAVAAELVRVRASCTDADRRRLVDDEAFAQRTLRVAEVTAQKKQAQLRAMRREGTLAPWLCDSLASRDDVVVLRVRADGGSARPLLRATDDARWPHYFDLELGKAGTGAVRIIDVTVYENGEPLSSTTARLLTDSAATGDSKAVGQVMYELRAARLADRRDEALRLLGRLPAQARNLRSIRLLEVEAIGVGEDADAYVAAIERYARDFPGDPAAEWLELDRQVLRKDRAALVAAVDRLDRRVGGDPQLNRSLADALLEMGAPEDLAEAERRARQLIESDPDVAKSWWLLVTTQLKRRDHAGVVVTLDELKRRFGMTFDHDEIAALPIYQEFLASPEFAAWWPTQAAAAQP